MHDLDYVATGKAERIVGVAVPEYRAVVLDDDEPRVQVERAEQARDRAIPADLPARSVHRQRDRVLRFRTLNHTLKYSG